MHAFSLYTTLLALIAKALETQATTILCSESMWKACQPDVAGP